MPAPLLNAPPLHRILFVDHARDTRSVVSFALTKIDGYEVVTCASASEALEAARRFRPDMLLMDVGMPTVDGIAALKLLREAGLKAPVVFFTSHLDTADLKRYRALGALGTIAKPFDPLKVAHQLEGLWRRHHQRASA